jgi:hypothetical protein
MLKLRYRLRSYNNTNTMFSFLLQFLSFLEPNHELIIINMLIMQIFNGIFHNFLLALNRIDRIVYK